MFPVINFRCRALIILTLLSALLMSCSSRKELPITQIQRQLKDVETFTIILDDMQEEGFFSTRYQHKYKIVTAEETKETEWYDVPKEYYLKNEPFLGMAILSKKDGEMDNNVSPPGYSYVGDSRYGKWRDDGSGGSFWEFYGKYRLFSDFMGGWFRPISRSDYNTYSDYSSRRQPYYGRNNEYGTYGSAAKTYKPDFFERKMSRQRASSQSFGDRVNSRVGRTKTTFRGRSGGFGK
ncbi:hypothetical protein [Desulforegula conservatrix]|uniref:hypothetical protein n=1 Tax=Desulforegula conservatrix TaxID=153026 RepID=UPI0003F6A274|nr:hypothetical protein [Desulforegula conservatrix]